MFKKAVNLCHDKLVGAFGYGVEHFVLDKDVFLEELCRCLIVFSRLASTGQIDR